MLETDADGRKWNEFVRHNSMATVFHRWEWRSVFSGTFGFRPRYWAALEGEDICGVFPAVIMRGIDMRKYWVSLPFLTCAGPIHVNEKLVSEFAAGVVEREVETASMCYQVRAVADIVLPECAVLDSYDTLVLDISGGQESVWKEDLHTQRRSQVRKARKNGLESRAGGLDLLDGFYDVWTRRINQLGTPVFPRRFFAEILAAFGDDAWIQGVLNDGRLAGAMLLLVNNRKSFDPWAATRQEFNRLGANGMLYWSAIEEACERGCMEFDMGRSERGGGTHKYKSEWGARPVPLYYYYNPPVPQNESAGEKYESLIRLWQRLPNRVANMIGPPVTRFLTDL